MAGKADSLNEKQRRFIEAYMGKAAGNGTEAARLAGYAGDAKTLSVAASRLLAIAKIRAAIELRVEADPLVMTRHELQRWWSSVARNNEEAMKDRLRASELLGKSSAIFIDKVEHSGGVRWSFENPGEAPDPSAWAEEATGG